MKLGGNRPPGDNSLALIDKWHGIFYMPSHAGHTNSFVYPVAEHWGESRNVQFRRWDSNRQHNSRSPVKSGLVCATGHIKDPVPLTEKVRASCSGGMFLLVSFN